MKRLYFIAICSVCACLIGIGIWCAITKPQRQYRFKPTTEKFEVNADDITYGVDTAPLTIIMFATFNCRHCRKFLSEDLPIIASHYIDNGRARFVLKPIELSENQDMLSALQLAICMNRNGEADDVIELLLTETSTIYTDDFRILISDIINGNPDLAECLTADDFSTIKKNNSDYSTLGSKLTPIFVIGQHFYVGRRRVEQFMEVIDYELSIIK